MLTSGLAMPFKLQAGTAFALASNITLISINIKTYFFPLED